MTETTNEISWITDTASAVRLARNTDETRKQADLLTDAKAALEKTLAGLQKLQQSAAAVRALSWEGRAPSPELSRDLEEARKTLDSRPLARGQRALDQFERDLTTSLKEHWKGYAAQRLGDFADLLALSETLSGVEGVAEVSQQLSETLGDLARSQTSLPTSQSVQLLARAEALLQQLESSLQPDGVRRFLSAVARGGASVDGLTSEVRGWLADHNSLGRFRIVAGPPVGDPDD